MKKILVILAVAGMLLVGCGPNEVKCDAAWAHVGPVIQLGTGKDSTYDWAAVFDFMEETGGMEEFVALGEFYSDDESKAMKYFVGCVEDGWRPGSSSNIYSTAPKK